MSDYQDDEYATPTLRPTRYGIAAPDTYGHRRADQLAWMDQANCLDAPPDLFFSTDAASLRAARLRCAACPVKAECGTYAGELEDEPTGTWAGNYRGRRG